jgi:hypothetical protein
MQTRAIRKSKPPSPSDNLVNYLCSGPCPPDIRDRSGITAFISPFDACIRTNMHWAFPAGRDSAEWGRATWKCLVRIGHGMDGSGGCLHNEQPRAPEGETRRDEDLHQP